MQLEVQDLHVRYGSVRAVSGISLTVQSGSITVILGVNGAGKTSMLRAIMGLVPSSSGRISLDGQELQGLAAHRIARVGMALCPEGRQLFPNMNVLENLTMGAFTRNDSEEVAVDLEKVLTRFPRLAERKKQRAGTLSGGEQQMLAIARSLMAKPDVLLMDEPTWGLAPLIVQEVAEVITQIRKDGTTVLLVEQNANVALEMSDYAYVFETGSVALEGPSAELRENDHVRSVYLGA